MDNDLGDFISRVQAAGSEGEIWDALLGFGQGLGLDHLHLWHGNNAEEVQYVTTYPEWWMRRYMDEGIWQDDIIAQHAMSGHGPLAFGLDKYGNGAEYAPETLRVFREAREGFGFGSGVSFSVFRPDGLRIGGLNLQVRGSRDRFARLPAPLVLSAAMAATAAHTRIYLLRYLGFARVALTAREKECLLWLSKGLRTKEISDRLDLSDATVNFHIANAKKKLGAESREQAVARAVLLGLIMP